MVVPVYTAWCKQGLVREILISYLSKLIFVFCELTTSENAPENKYLG